MGQLCLALNELGVKMKTTIELVEISFFVEGISGQFLPDEGYSLVGFECCSGLLRRNQNPSENSSPCPPVCLKSIICGG